MPNLISKRNTTGGQPCPAEFRQCVFSCRDVSPHPRAGVFLSCLPPLRHEFLISENSSGQKIKLC